MTKILSEYIRFDYNTIRIHKNNWLILSSHIIHSAETKRILYCEVPDKCNWNDTDITRDNSFSINKIDTGPLLAPKQFKRGPVAKVIVTGTTNSSYHQTLKEPLFTMWYKFQMNNEKPRSWLEFDPASYCLPGWVLT